MSRSPTIHGSAVLLGERGILVRGVSGAGKSMLVLELLSANPDGARLVADDRVIVAAAHGRLLANVPGEIAGLIEMRGVGLVRRPYVAPVVVRLVVDLLAVEACPRLPEAKDAQVELEGIVLPRLALPIGIDGAAVRVSAAAAAILGPGG
jgi:serine kinase of HPr protein (carbohydrate metabolism regulator)